MDMLHEGMEEVSKKDYIKANAIADKAIASMYGLDKSIKKEEMAPDMLRDRQPILEKTVKLMLMQSEFGMDFSVSKVVYKKFASDGK
jgi:hypothetical protein